MVKVDYFPVENPFIKQIQDMHTYSDTRYSVFN